MNLEERKSNKYGRKETWRKKKKTIHLGRKNNKKTEIKTKEWYHLECIDLWRLAQLVKGGGVRREEGEQAATTPTAYHRREERDEGRGLNLTQGTAGEVWAIYNMVR